MLFFRVYLLFIAFTFLIRYFRVPNSSSKSNGLDLFLERLSIYHAQGTLQGIVQGNAKKMGITGKSLIDATLQNVAKTISGQPRLFTPPTPTFAEWVGAGTRTVHAKCSKVETDGGKF